MLTVRDLAIKRGDKNVLSNISFQIAPGELVAVVGPNGVGKSTLALTLLGHPSCAIVKGTMELDGVDLTKLKIHERAKAGLFLAHQEPPAIAGVSVANALRSMSDATRPEPYSTAEFFDQLRASLKRLELSEDFMQRQLHDGLSGGEKKRLELLMLLVLAPKYAILDELDSGMDVAARAMAAEIVASLQKTGTGFLVISHNDQFLNDLNVTQTISL